MELQVRKCPNTAGNAGETCSLGALGTATTPLRMCSRSQRSKGAGRAPQVHPGGRAQGPEQRNLAAPVLEQQAINRHGEVSRRAGGKRTHLMVAHCRHVRHAAHHRPQLVKVAAPSKGGQQGQSGGRGPLLRCATGWDGAAVASARLPGHAARQQREASPGGATKHYIT